MKYLLMLGALCASVVGCGAAEEADEQVDCGQICVRYADCFDDDYDVSECQDNCTDQADADENFAKKVEACDECIDDRSCSEGTFACVDECVGIVP